MSLLGADRFRVAFHGGIVLFDHRLDAVAAQATAAPTPRAAAHRNVLGRARAGRDALVHHFLGGALTYADVHRRDPPTLLPQVRLH
ncbi:hypothetical protein RHCRD62_10902 [Rhodococcus sp. RD6.2]|nr:hypothetical protein RHCRD62_10902 [Rhodococcus sp. RD6.2]